MELNEARSLMGEVLIDQEAERVSGYTVGNPALARVVKESDSERLVDLSRALRRGTLPEQELALRLLESPPIDPETIVSEVQDAAGVDADAALLQRAAAALSFARRRSALGYLHRLAEHDEAVVRFAVPDALSACAGGFDDVADALLRLSADEDDDVRWSAAFELAAWLQDSVDDRIKDRLTTLTTDPSSPVRDVAVEALDEASKRD